MLDWGRRDPSIEPIVIRSGRDPLDLIAEDHWRQRGLLSELAALCAGVAPDFDRVRALLDWIGREVPVHTRDEDDDLLPLLRRRAEPDDNVEAIIERVCGEHLAAACRIDIVRRALERFLARPTPPLDDLELDAVRDHVAAELRHLIFENAIVLPLARARLTASDRRSLALRMAARRGYCLWPRSSTGDGADA